MSKRKVPIVSPDILILEGLWSDTADAVRAAGGRPTETSPWDWPGVEQDISSGYYHGMILTGGSDVNPNLYGEDEIHPQVYGIDNWRDSVEYTALRYAEKQKIPVLGICRGSQIMAVYKGGKLVQHIGDDHRGSEHHVYAHPNARTWKRAANSRDMRVVSLHHQCVAKPGKGMRIAAAAHDGTPEAVESKDGLWLGVQYHPEINAFENGNSFAIFQWLVGMAARRAGGRAPATRFRSVRKPTLRLPTPEPIRDLNTGTSVVLCADGKPCDYGCTTGCGDWAEHQLEPGFDVSPEATQNTVQVTASPAKKPRQAGDPAIPSMRDAIEHAIERSIMKYTAEVIEGTQGVSIHFDAEATAELEERLLLCPHCALEFDLIEDRDDHVKVVHSTALTCPYCGLDFDHHNQLDDHMEVRHRGEYPFVPFANAAARYPELEPPPGHPAWDTINDYEDVDDQNYILARYGYEGVESHESKNDKYYRGESRPREETTAAKYDRLLRDRRKLNRIH